MAGVNAITAGAQVAHGKADLAAEVVDAPVAVAVAVAGADFPAEASRDPQGLYAFVRPQVTRMALCH